MKQVIKTKKLQSFRRFNAIALIAVYVLILVGGIVRSTGSGMGCPDWPKCFGEWTPPTNASQLPDNYKEVYQKKRQEKSKKLASFLSAVGLDQLASDVEKEVIAAEESDFNKRKTWTEYLNRLSGMLIGIFIFAMLLTSFPLRKVRPRIFYLSVAAFLLVAFLGWTGSLVVSTNLLTWMVSFHMLLALGLVALLIYLRVIAKEAVGELKNIALKKRLRSWLVVVIVMSLIQIILGTQVREAVDVVARALGDAVRNEWVAALGLPFYIHRSFSILIVGVHMWLIYVLYKNDESGEQKLTNYIKLLFSLVVLEVGTGIVMAYFAIPAILQPIHLLLASVVFGVQFYLFLQLRNKVLVTEKDFIN